MFEVRFLKNNVFGKNKLVLKKIHVKIIFQKYHPKSEDP